MRTRLPLLILPALLAGAAPAPRVAALHRDAHHVWTRVNAVAAKAPDASLLSARVERLPAPIGWMMMLGAFGLLGTLLRERRTDGRMDPATFR